MSDPRFSPQDHTHMAQALGLAARGRARQHPNPMAGCVLVRAGEVVGTGYQQAAGDAHAAAHALRMAGDRARGATAYVTLEPRADALIQAGVTRVVIAMLKDPTPDLTGQGVHQLRDAGIDVAVGLMEAEARRLNRPWLTWLTTGRPMVVLKACMTLDGRIASGPARKEWVTSDEARLHIHQLRDQADAVLVGVGTVLADNPALTTRIDTPAGPAPDPWQPRDPHRIVLDSLLRTPATAQILSPEIRQRAGAQPGETIIATTSLAAERRKLELRTAGATILEYASRDGLVPLAPLLDDLGRRGICSLLVEGGPQVHWSFLQQGLADRVLFYLSPKLIGGMQAPGPVAGPGLRMPDALPVQNFQVEHIGPDLLLHGDLRPAP